MASKTDATAEALHFYQKQEFDKAIASLNSAIFVDATNAHAWFLLGTIYTQQNSLPQAENAFRECLQCNGTLPDAHNNLGVVLQAQNKVVEAQQCYVNAIKFNPKYANALYNLGSIQQQNGDYDEALINYQLALKYKPDYAKALNNLAMVYQTKGKSQKAIPLYEKALRYAVDDPEILNNLGYSHFCAYDYQKALEYYQAALAQHPDFAPVINNIGLLLQSTGDYQSAKSYFTKAAEHPEYFASAMNNLAQLDLGNLEFTSGWDFYQHRASVRMNRQHFAQSIEIDLSNKTILLHRDQGLGDEIFFSRYIPLLLTRGANVSIMSDPRIADLFQRCFPTCQVVHHVAKNHQFDYVVSIADLPRLLQHTSDDPLPPATSITPLHKNVETINNLLPNNNRINIAINWQAGVQGQNKLFKRIPPEKLGKMLRFVDANILILQRNPSNQDIKALEKNLHKKAFNYAFMNESLEDTIAILSQVDQYIGVSSTNIHLLAGLAKTTHVFVPHPPEWRWLHTSESSPWFPEFKIYRQDISGTWDNAFNQCHNDILETT